MREEEVMLRAIARAQHEAAQADVFADETAAAGGGAEPVSISTPR